MVEVFSAGWHQKSTFQRHEWSPALSVEFIPDMYDYNEYSVTWLELSRRPPVAEGIGKFANALNQEIPIDEMIVHICRRLSTLMSGIACLCQRFDMV